MLVGADGVYSKVHLMSSHLLQLMCEQKHQTCVPQSRAFVNAQKTLVAVMNGDLTLQAFAGQSSDWWAYYRVLGMVDIQVCRVCPSPGLSLCLQTLP